MDNETPSGDGAVVRDKERREWFAKFRTCTKCGKTKSGATVETMSNGIKRGALECLHCSHVKAYIPKRLMVLGLDELPPKGFHPEGYDNQNGLLLWRKP